MGPESVICDIGADNKDNIVVDGACIGLCGAKNLDEWRLI